MPLVCTCITRAPAWRQSLALFPLWILCFHICNWLCPGWEHAWEGILCIVLSEPLRFASSNFSLSCFQLLFLQVCLSSHTHAKLPVKSSLHLEIAELGQSLLHIEHAEKPSQKTWRFINWMQRNRHRIWACAVRKACAEMWANLTRSTYSMPGVTLPHASWSSQPQYGSREAIHALAREKTQKVMHFLLPSQETLLLFL